MGRMFQLPGKVERKNYECLICYTDIKKKTGVCDKCAEDLLEQGWVICDRCHSTHLLRGEERVVDIHCSAKSLLIGKQLNGRLIFLGACKNCDPEMEIKKVRTHHYKVR